MNHPSHYTETVPSLQGGTIQLKAIVDLDVRDGRTYVDIWGQIDRGNPIYPPRDPDKSIAKHGGVEGYKKSPARGLFHHISIGRYLGFSMRARTNFQHAN